MCIMNLIWDNEWLPLQLVGAIGSMHGPSHSQAQTSMVSISAHLVSIDLTLSF